MTTAMNNVSNTSSGIEILSMCSEFLPHNWSSIYRLIRYLIQPIILAIKEALYDEHLYRPLAVAVQSNMPGEVTLELRDGVVHLLRFVRAELQTPYNIFFAAVTYLDLFLEITRVKAKQLKLVAISCYLAALVRYRQTSFPEGAEKLASLSHCNFPIQEIISQSRQIYLRLKLCELYVKMTNAADFLGLYLDYLDGSTALFREILEEEDLWKKLEVLMAHSTCAFLHPSTLAYILIRWEFEKLKSNRVTMGTPQEDNFVNMYMFDTLKDLQNICNISAAEMVKSSHCVSKVLKQYNNEDKCKNNMYLKWRNVSKSLRIYCPQTWLKNIQKTTLPPITERRAHLPIRKRKAQLRKPSTA